MKIWLNRVRYDFDMNILKSGNENEAIGDVIRIWYSGNENETVRVWCRFDMDFLDSGNQNEAQLISWDPIMISTGTWRDKNAERALIIFNMV
jgi:hypothetical protein